MSMAPISKHRVELMKTGVDDLLRFIGISDEWRTVVGVVSDVRDYGPGEKVGEVIFQPI